MIPLQRKVMLRQQARDNRAAQRNVLTLSRQSQVAQSTVPVGELDVPVTDAVQDAHELAGDMPGYLDDTYLAGDDAYEAWDQSEYAKELAAQLETELGEAQVELEKALADAAEALDEAGLAKTAAAEAVAGAQAATEASARAIADAMAALDAADGAVPSWSLVDPVAADAEGRPIGSVWWVRDSSGRVLRVWELTALGWVSRPFDETAIPQIAIGSGTYGALSGDRLVAKSVTAAQIEALSITAGELAANAVTVTKLAAGAVTTAKLDAGAVTTEKLWALAVTAEKLAVGAVVAEKIAAGAITTEKLAATAIDGMTITGALIRTAPSGQRMQFDVNGLSAFDAFGRSTSSLFSDGRGMQLAGAKGRISFSPGVMSGSQIMMESDPDEVEDAWDSGRIYLGSATGVYQGERVRSIGLDLAAGIPFGENYPAGTPRYEVSIMRSKTGKTYGFTDIANIDEFVYTAGSKTPGENSEVSAQIKSLALGIRNLGEARLRLTPGLTKSTISVGREGSYGGELELSAHTVSLDADEVRYRGDHDWFNLSYTPGHQAGTAAQAQVCRVGGIVYYRGGAHKFTGTFTGGETWIVAEGGIPEWARPTQNVRFGGGASGRRPAYLLITSAGAVIACPDPGNSMPSWISGATSYPQ